MQVSNDDPDNYLVTPGDKNTESFGVTNGLALALVLGLVGAGTVILSRNRTCFKYFSFFMVEKPYTKMELSPIPALQQTPVKVTKTVQKLKHAVLPYHLPT